MKNATVYEFADSKMVDENILNLKNPQQNLDWIVSYYSSTVFFTRQKFKETLKQNVPVLVCLELFAASFKSSFSDLGYKF